MTRPALALACVVLSVAACATGSSARPARAGAASEVIAVAAPPATTPPIDAPSPDVDVRPSPLPPPRWINTPGGGAGFLPAGDGYSGSFHAVDSADGIRETVGRYRRVAFSITPSRLCALAAALEPARANVSIDLDIMSSISVETAKCLARLHPPAISFSMPVPRPPKLPPSIIAMLSHLDDCEALGISYADDEVARFLGERVDAPGGASLRSLALVQGRLSAEGFSALAKRTKLREVAFRGTSSTRANGTPTGIAALAALADLERLDLSYGDVTDDDVAAFAGSKRLSWLMLESTKVGRGVAALSGLRELAYVNLNFTDADDATAEVLANLPRLRHLALARTRITDRAIAALARATSLEELVLELTHVTDASLAIIAKLPKLRAVALPSSLSRAQVDAFRTAHPKLQVSYSP